MLHFDINRSPIENIHEFNFLVLIAASASSSIKVIGNKISRVIGLLHKLKHIFPSYLLRMICKS